MKTRINIGAVGNTNTAIEYSDCNVWKIYYLYLAKVLAHAHST